MLKDIRRNIHFPRDFRSLSSFDFSVLRTNLSIRKRDSNVVRYPETRVVFAPSSTDTAFTMNDRRRRCSAWCSHVRATASYCTPLPPGQAAAMMQYACLFAGDRDEKIDPQTWSISFTIVAATHACIEGEILPHDLPADTTGSSVSKLCYSRFVGRARLLLLSSSSPIAPQLRRLLSSFSRCREASTLIGRVSGNYARFRICHCNFVSRFLRAQLLLQVRVQAASFDLFEKIHINMYI